MTKVLIVWNGVDDPAAHLYLMPENLVSDYLECNGKILNGNEFVVDRIANKIEHLAAMLGEENHYIKIPSLEEIAEANKLRDIESIKSQVSSPREEGHKPVVAPWARFRVSNIIEIMERGSIKVLQTGWLC